MICTPDFHSARVILSKNSPTASDTFGPRYSSSFSGIRMPLATSITSALTPCPSSSCITKPVPSRTGRKNTCRKKPRSTIFRLTNRAMMKEKIRINTVWIRVVRTTLRNIGTKLISKVKACL